MGAFPFSGSPFGRLVYGYGSVRNPASTVTLAPTRHGRRSGLIPGGPPVTSFENAPPLDDWKMPDRPLRRCCGLDQATVHCVTCGYLIPPSPAPVVVEPIDDWPYSLISTLGEN